LNQSARSLYGARSAYLGGRGLIIELARVSKAIGAAAKQPRARELHVMPHACTSKLRDSRSQSSRELHVRRGFIFTRQRIGAWRRLVSSGVGHYDARLPQGNCVSRVRAGRQHFTIWPCSPQGHAHAQVWGRTGRAMRACAARQEAGQCANTAGTGTWCNRPGRLQQARAAAAALLAQSAAQKL
jgi:hypothetical protein